jgi:hypothetical protein
MNRHTETFEIVTFPEFKALEYIETIVVFMINSKYIEDRESDATPQTQVIWSLKLKQSGV